VLVAVGEKSVVEGLLHLFVLLDTRTPRDGFFFRSPEGDAPQSEFSVESLTMPETEDNLENPLPLGEVERLVELLQESGVGEIRVRQGETEISVRARAEVPAAPPQPAPQGVPEMVEPEPSPEMDGLHAVRSPVVGTFYRAPAPGEDPYVEVGDAVSAGQTMCIVEAMKLMNEIVADVSGEVVEVLAENAGGVEYDQPLFYLRPEEQ
jgi:acetyl-CoA carboxylase biotin carboxyl carrier protein